MSVVDQGRLPALPRARRRSLLLAAVVVSLVAVALGLLGTFRYLRGYWLYRGFPPPQDPTYVRQAGTSKEIDVRSDALGGRTQPVYVYLPPGYDSHPNRRYPVFYLLHGFPGRPQGAFLFTAQVGVLEDVIVTKKLAPPVILAMPYGSTSWLTDKEWANGVRPHENWETFVAKDVVDAIDKNYRTLPTGASRAIGGLSEGGYGALNIAVHHPGEFRVVESWSGYEKADNLKSIFGGEQRLLAYNSPLDTIRSAAPALRRAHTFFWFYSGRDDPFHKQNDRFAAELTTAHIAHRYLLFPGGHNWGLWRRNAMRALLVASRSVASG